MISRAKMRKRNDKKTVESKEGGQRKVLQKSFTKKKKKIGLPVQFEDSKTRVDAQVRFKWRVVEGLCFNENIIWKHLYKAWIGQQIIILSILIWRIGNNIKIQHCVFHFDQLKILLSSDQLPELLIFLSFKFEA